MTVLIKKYAVMMIGVKNKNGKNQKGTFPSFIPNIIPSNTMSIYTEIKKFVSTIGMKYLSIISSFIPLFLAIFFLKNAIIEMIWGMVERERHRRKTKILFPYRLGLPSIPKLKGICSGKSK
jgi:hypothetical protein